MLELEMPIGRGAFALVYEVADDHGNDEIAFLRDGNAFGMARPATDHAVAIESGATGQGADADGETFLGRREAFVQQVESVTRSTSSSVTTPVSQLPQKPILGRT